MISLILFIFGAAIGSFLNVVALRYDGDHFLFDPAAIGGRSHCPHCNRKLHWFELVPVVSFLIQRARCRGCHAKIGVQYPAVEIGMGILFVAVPWSLSQFGAAGLPLILLAALWIAIFAVLVLMAYIDIRLSILPDECHVILGVLAFLVVAVTAGFWGAANHSFFNPYSWFLGFQQNIWVAHIIGALFGFIFFEILVLITRGKGMGMGDVKFALPLGFLFGWPDIVPVVLLAFVIGALVGVVGIALKWKTMKGTLPFAPFLALSTALIFFFGSGLMQWYLKFLGM